jgi:tRNA modification GTPase
MTETIFAPATAAGRAAVAVVRVSGPATRDGCGGTGGHGPAAAPAAFAACAMMASNWTRRLVLWFEGPASYTGEDSRRVSRAWR